MSTLKYIVHHVFLPPKLPQEDDYTAECESALCRTVYDSASEFGKSGLVLPENIRRWDEIVKMLENTSNFEGEEGMTTKRVKEALAQMKEGSILAFLIREQNAGVIFRRHAHEVIYEAFEVSPPTEAIMGAPGKLSCSFPGPAIAIPVCHFDSSDFRHELASFLVHMNVDVLDSVATTSKAGSEVVEERNSTHPRYITALLTGIFRGIGKPADVVRIRKRVADDIVWMDAKIPWRRSMVWLVIRVAIQTQFYDSLDYKFFMAFLLCDILDRAVVEGLTSDMLFSMRIKVATRIHKLGTNAPDFLVQRANQVADRVESLLQKRWSDVQDQQAQLPLWDPVSLRARAEKWEDTFISLPHSGQYIKNVLNNKRSQLPSQKFIPSLPPRPFRNLRNFESCTEDVLCTTFSKDTHLSLADLEKSIQDNLDSWVAQHIADANSASILFDILNEYLSTAKDAYSSSQEDQSSMLLTLFDLWVALDKVVVNALPLLEDYRPDISLTLFEPLLLRNSASFDQLARIHRYLRLRHCEANLGSVFTDGLYSNSFAARFFDGSVKLQLLKDEIEGYAEREREKKREEYREKRREYEEKINQADGMRCQYYDNGWGRSNHSPYCKKCQLTKEANNISIGVHEWPLPLGSHLIKAVLFELGCPDDYIRWRDATYTLLNDLCQTDEGRQRHADPAITLCAYSGLRRWKTTTGRLSLASTSKSFLQSHYSSISIHKAHQEKDVIVAHGLTYKLYDHENSMWAASPFSALDVSDLCTLPLPSTGPYTSLKTSVSSTKRTPNSALADQSECHDNMNLHEFISFNTLRSGEYLQWLNIARELRARILTFHKEEVHVLLIQSAWQVGKLSESGEFEWHADLKSTSFCETLLSELSYLLDDIKSNWMEAVTARSIAALCSRVLASNTEAMVEQQACKLMRCVRAVAYDWMKSLLLDCAANDMGELVLRERQSLISEMALTCRGTYGVDEKHLGRLLNTSQDIAIFVECGIRIFDNVPVTWDTLPLPMQRLLHRDRRLAHFMEPTLLAKIRLDQVGIKDAVTAVWNGYCPGTPWANMEAPNDRWIVCSTSKSGEGSKEQEIHLNILEGRMLVDGMPLSRLPIEITRDPTFIRIFGSRVFDVVPSNIDGLKFASRRDISGYQVHFAMQTESGELIVQAKDLKSSTRLELIPHKKFIGDLPELMVQEYVQWLDFDRREVEFRPLESFRIEDRDFLTVTLSATSVLDVDLPRFRLSFTVNSDDNLECTNFPGMCIDDNQSVGTFFGLRNMLVLKPSAPAQLRRALIPQGKVAFGREGHHVAVSVETPSSLRNLQYHEYLVRTDLGCLEGDGSLASHFYRAYLHALTSHCLPDPLTGRTGTAESLSILTSSRSFSFQNFQNEDLKILSKFQLLTPRRCFYPEYLQVMQTVFWSDLPFLSQHPRYLHDTQAIFEFCEHLWKLQVDDRPNPFSKHRVKNEQGLVDRDYRRNSKFYVTTDILLEENIRNQDQSYVSRDTKLATEHTCCEIASSVFLPSPSPLITLLDTLKQWGSIHGPRRDSVSLTYSREWLDQRILSNHWLTLYDLCRQTSVPQEKKKYQLLYSLPSLAYGNTDCHHLLHLIVQFATDCTFETITPPDWSVYDLSNGTQPISSRVSAIVTRSAMPKEYSPSSKLSRNYWESDQDYGRRRQQHYDDERRLGTEEVTEALLSQWRTTNPRYPRDAIRESLFDRNEVMAEVEKLFKSWFWNGELERHVETVQDLLRRNHSLISVSTSEPSKYSFEPSKGVSSYSDPPYPDINQLLLGVPPPPGLADSCFMGFHDSGSDHLQSLIQHLINNTSRIGQLLGKELHGSANALSLRLAPLHVETLDNSNLLKIVDDYSVFCFDQRRNMYEKVCEVLSPRSDVEKLLHTSGLWPFITPYTLLRLLSFDQRSHLPNAWKQALKVYGKTVAEHQRSQRLLYQISNDKDAFIKEIEEVENTREAGLDDVDWLLIQISGNFAPRRIQVAVAKEMMKPSSSRNSVLQLNMGEGKSSVIVPMIAPSLSDGHKFVRVVVLKALSTQMFQLLVDRVSALANRRVYYLPFSRDLKINEPLISTIQELYKECMEKGGVLVAQPEHILSFRLMVLDHLLDPCHSQQSLESEASIRKMLVDSYRWLYTHSRDILDESDEILHVRYQLIYTMGMQRSLEDYPNRWTTVQEVFGLLLEHASSVREDFPLGIRVHDNHTRGQEFPVITLVHSDAERKLLDLIVSDILEGRLSNYSFERLPHQVRAAARRFICEREVKESEVTTLFRYCSDTGHWKGLLLLRGLIAHGLLAYTLKERRWRVDYGLDERRTLLAVPYRAKDVPSLRAEFGHPDVAICLTCLSYYYRGLTPSQLDASFELLMKSDNPALEYERWAEGVQQVPRNINGINLRDEQQRITVLFPHLSRNRSVVNFYLSQVVFPKYAKEFPEKLTTCGWDIAEGKENFTTGFSGTKDSQYLLPTTISQCDPLKQESTNAKVIEYLLLPENSNYECVKGENNTPLSASDFLQRIVNQDKEIRVLLDVGAQILDLENEGVARRWLELREDVEAALFFNKQDQMMIVDCQGNVEKLISSQYRNQLGKCVIYLDDAHTRGTDLKLPRDYRAAVTLGPKVTKDRLLQGCMRMRKVGNGQSVKFFASFEIDKRIRCIARLEDEADISSLDVLKWAYLETTADIKHHIPRWLRQGSDYLKRKEAWDRFNTSGSASELETAWLRPEARTLEQMYGIGEKEKNEFEQLISDIGAEYPEMRQQCELLGYDITQSTSEAAVDEEQEREVSNEVEMERQVERPPKREPAVHKISEDVRRFIKSGNIPENSMAFRPVFKDLDTNTKSEHRRWLKGMVSTIDFASTVKNLAPAINDYMRPVTWVISGGFLEDNTPALVVISPFEANELRSEIARNNVGLHLHVYAPRVTQNQSSFEDLRFYAIPPLPSSWNPPDPMLVTQLNIFTGQLYLRDWETYKQLCRFLGLYLSGTTSTAGYDPESDGFVKPEHQSGGMSELCPFETSPLPELKKLFGMRRKGNGYAMTHIGRIVGGRSLTEEDF
ncbi:hypothetical protein K435DRAFT_767927 [Dendrothele bispora CBS 962.96]|uniref:ubiquitinyl hydrolase 1 n=1 Tax=Dendrothele bispora (strain CBS 962.96) TaxID=1314807 RepID=A0A4V4HBS6_DENBC|nr:hypothetical protein K435DRAFT_767927 [Dendrothele bispora CBS 962.96]